MKHYSQLETTVGAVAHAFLALPSYVSWLLCLLFFVMNFIANWKIVQRAGYPGCWSLMLLIPYAGFFFLLCFAFGRWPVEGKRSR